MMISSYGILLASAASVAAFPNAEMMRRASTVTGNPYANPTGIPTPLGPNDNDPRFTQFSPPGPGDVRSPCPGLNTLANHGFIPHNGKNMTIPVLVEGLAAGMNIGEDFSIAIGAAGLLSAPLAEAGSFDLNDLDEHNFPIEHDASLSRRDAYFGNDYSFYAPNWDVIVDTYNGSEYTSIPVAAKAKYKRTSNSLATNPTFTYGPREFILSYGENALYLQTMSNSTTSGVAPFVYVRSLFEKEMLPYNIGWRPNPTAITLASLAEMAGELFFASGEEAPEGVLITEGTFKDAFEGVDPLTGLLGNITSA